MRLDSNHETMKQEQIILNACKAMLQGALNGLIDYMDNLDEINRSPHCIGKRQGPLNRFCRNSKGRCPQRKFMQS